MSLIMFGMGLTLTVSDFKRVLSNKRVIVLGVFLQYSVMPLAAFLVSLALQLPNELMIGMVLVGAASGGTASNVICYLAKADVALSVSMTLVSTLFAVVMLPALTLLYLDQMIQVPAVSMMWSVAKIVIIPVVLGVTLHHFLATPVQKLQPILPGATTLAIALIIAIIVAINVENLATLGGILLFAVVVHNGIGLLSGYCLARLFGQSKQVSRTVAIEVGMQNSGLAVALAVKHFAPLAALPGAVFSIWHNLSGSVLAAKWNATSKETESKQ